MPGAKGSRGCVRSSAWIWLFSSTHNTIAFSGGSMYSPTMSRTFSTNSGSLESLKVSWRWGCSPNARQMRDTAVCDRPTSRAIVRVLQCVAAWGTLSRSEEHTSELQSQSNLVCRLLLEKIVYIDSVRSVVLPCALDRVSLGVDLLA